MPSERNGCWTGDSGARRHERSRALRVVILGPDGAGKSSVIAGLMKNLLPAAEQVRPSLLRVSQVKMRHLKPRFVAQAVGSPITIVTDPHGKPPRGALFSLAKMAAWLCEEWYAYMFFERDTLLVCDRYFHDLLVDPRRYRFGAWLWTARLAGRLMPQPKLWILLDAPADVLQARKQEVEPQETARQCAAYRVFVSGTRCHAIVDASRPLEAVIEDASRAIAGVVGYEAGDA